jgi:hypothetical protein
MSVQLASSPPFFLPGVDSPPANVAMLWCRVTLPFHGAKTSSLPPLHRSIMVRPIIFPLGVKLKH